MVAATIFRKLNTVLVAIKRVGWAEFSFNVVAFFHDTGALKNELLA